MSKPSNFIPSSVKRSDIYHGGWIDHDKDGVMASFEDPSRPIDERVEDLLSRMNLEEKVAQLRSDLTDRLDVGNLSVVLRGTEPAEGAVKANDIQRRFLEDTRLGIPAIIHDECLHGCMAKHSTVFPQAIALAATWDVDLMYRVAKAIAREARVRGIRQCLSPVVNLTFDARAGRTEETYGEDPYLASQLAYAYVKALREEGIIATPKHYIMNFVGDGGRDSAEIHMSERFIRETELPVFRAAIKAGALSLMAAYNSIDGVPCSMSKYWLTEVLRWELGFEGFVVSDYGSVTGIINRHYITDNPEEAAKLALEAGLDVEFPGFSIYGEPLIRAIRRGLISEGVLNEAVRRVLRAKFLIGLFDSPYVDPEEAKVVGSEEHKRIALEAAEKAIVLLKNDGVLPIDKSRVKSIALIGPFADEVRLGGYSAIPKSVITPLEAFKARGVNVIHAKGCIADMDSDYPIPVRYLTPMGEPNRRGLRGEYFNNPNLEGEPIGVRIDAPWEGFFRLDIGYDPPYQGLDPGRYSIRWIGYITPPATGTYEFKVYASGGGFRLTVDGKVIVDSWGVVSNSPKSGSIRLEGGRQYEVKLEYGKLNYGYAYIKLGWDLIEDSMIKEAIEAASKADAVVVFAGIIEGEQRDRASLRLPKCQERLIEEVLKVNKNVTVVLTTGSPVIGDWINKVPALVEAWYPGEMGGEAIAQVLLGEYNPGGKLPVTWPMHEGQEPLYYFTKPSGRVYDYVNMPPTPLFPFGHGLSYTQFKYSDLKVSVNEDDGVVSVSLNVENVGKLTGDEVIQLYIRDRYSSIARPLMMLRGFRRITLKPGERTAVEFKLTLDDLAMYDSGLRRIVEPGTYQVLVGSSSMDIRLMGEFKLTKLVRGIVNVVNVNADKASVKVGDLISVKATLRNEGKVGDLVPIMLKVNGRVIEEHKVYLDPGEERTVNFTVRLHEVGKQVVSVAVPEGERSITIDVAQ
ncbi:beta-glucosidase [Caldivirga sp. UBA161]|uniref:beta-glucosidase n=1 Tax=Caldivirga sp. UBA161 TaxID=1915569 RepID=UPI0025C43B8B|nr:beta-glucosidase [Caldivirga sp. UBA161]